MGMGRERNWKRWVVVLVVCRERCSNSRGCGISARAKSRATMRKMLRGMGAYEAADGAA